MTRTTRVTLALAGTAALVGWMATRSEGPGPVVEPRGPDERAGEVGPRVSPLELRLGDLAAISGFVRDPDGREIAGATVCAGSDWRELSQHEREERVCVLSEDDGSYRVEGLLPVPHFVQASAPWFVPGRFKGVVTLRVGQDTGAIDVVLRTGGVELKGVVRDRSGGELEGALVASEDAQVRSGVDGSFALWVAPGAVYVSARAEGYAPEGARGVAPGQVFEISLTPESVLIGRVVRDGAPLVGAQVWVQKSAGWARAGPVVTDDEGGFRLEGLKPGAYKPEALHDEAYGTAEESATLGPGETAMIEIVAHPAHLVEGTVYRSDGAVCAGGSAGLRGGSDDRRAAIEADGSLQFKGVLAGAYELKIECADAVPRQELVVVDRPLRGLRWQVERGRAIRGQVVLHSGAGVPGVWVDADAQVDAAALLARVPEVRRSRTEPSGAFEIAGLSPGRYSLTSRGEGYPGPERAVMVEVAEGQDVAGVKISLPATGELRGVVVDSEGRPARATEVCLRDEGGSTLLATRTADDGRFHLAHVPAREYRVVAAIGPQTLRGSVVVKIAVGKVHEVRVVVEPAPRVSDAETGVLR